MDQQYLPSNLLSMFTLIMFFRRKKNLPKLSKQHPSFIRDSILMRGVSQSTCFITCSRTNPVLPGHAVAPSSSQDCSRQDCVKDLLPVPLHGEDGTSVLLTAVILGFTKDTLVEAILLTHCVRLVLHLPAQGIFVLEL